MFKMNLRKFALPVCMLYMSGCASIVSGGPKTMPIMSQPDEATIEIIDMKNDNATILKAKTPYTATLERSAGFFSPAKYKVRISKDGYMPHETQIDAGVNGWYFGNIIFGGLIGILIVDPATGAMYKIYEDNVNVKLYQATSEGKIAMAKEKYNGQAPLKSNDYDKAIEDLGLAFSLYPEYAEGYCTRAMCYLKKNDLDKALEDANKAIEIKADYPNAYTARAEIYMKKGQNDKALEDANKAIALKADYADAYLVRGKLNQKRQDMVSAKADIQKAAELGNEAARNYQF